MIIKSQLKIIFFDIHNKISLPVFIKINIFYFIDTHNCEKCLVCLSSNEVKHQKPKNPKKKKYHPECEKSILILINIY